MLGDLCGLIDADRIAGIPADDNVGICRVGWMHGSGRALRLVLELAESPGRLDALTISASLFADLCRYFGGGIFEICMLTWMVQDAMICVCA